MKYLSPLVIFANHPTDYTGTFSRIWIKY